MNYDDARQIDPNSDTPDAGKWRYTTANRRSGTHATGACSNFQPCPQCKGTAFARQDADCICAGQGYVDLLDQTCPGHDTAEEAYAHQTEWLLENRVTHGTMSNQQQPCQVCKEWTSNYAQVDNFRQFVLCKKHDLPHVIKDLFGTVGQVWHS